MLRWWGGEVTETIIGRAADRYVPPLRDQLGDTDKSQWETEPTGARRDPWARTFYLVLKNASNNELVTFASSSNGGRKAVAKLADKYDRERTNHGARMPVVLLASDSY